MYGAIAVECCNVVYREYLLPCIQQALTPNVQKLLSNFLVHQLHNPNHKQLMVYGEPPVYDQVRTIPRTVYNQVLYKHKTWLSESRFG